MKLPIMLLFATLVAGAQGAPISPRYTITDLGGLGGPTSEALAINDAGQVVGQANTATDSTLHAFLYSAGVFTDLGSAFGPGQSTAVAINNRGQIAGTGIDPTGQILGNSAILLYQDGVTTWLDGPYHSNFGHANGLNDLGVVVGVDSEALDGYLDQDADQAEEFIYLTPAEIVSNATFTQVPSLDGGPFWETVKAINNRNQIVGGATTNQNRLHAFLYDQGTMTDLGTLAGKNDRFGAESIARAINDAGDIVGTSGDENDDPHPFLYRNGRMTDLDPAGNWTEATGINASGDIVGNGFTAKGYRPTVYVYHDGQAYDVATLLPRNSGWSLLFASAINASGQIVGFGRATALDYHRAYLLTPVATLQLSTPVSVRTKHARFTIRGTALGTVSHVSYRVGSKGNFHKARGGLGWRIPVNLRHGKTTVTIFAHGPSGDSLPETITIVRQ